MRATDNTASGRSEEAAAWHTRLHSDAASEADFLAFEQWVSDAANRDAFDRIDRALARVDAHRGSFAATLADRPAQDFTWRVWAAPTIAALAALIFFLVKPPPPHWTPYSAPLTETRSVELADGSVMLLNRRAHAQVAFERGARRVRVEGEAAFDVRHDPARPFVVEAGGQHVRVVGTEFNVLQSLGDTIVTVRRGVVRVGSSGPGPEMDLHAGEQAIHSHRAGEWLVHTADADAAMAWRTGRLVYADAPLAVVVADLNRYFERPIRIGDSSLADVSFSGVLVIDTEDRVLGRLQAFLPLAVNTSDEETVLHRRK